MSLTLSHSQPLQFHQQQQQYPQKKQHQQQPQQEQRKIVEGDANNKHTTRTRRTPSQHGSGIEGMPLVPGGVVPAPSTATTTSINIQRMLKEEEGDTNTTLTIDDIQTNQLLLSLASTAPTVHPYPPHIHDYGGRQAYSPPSPRQLQQPPPSSSPVTTPATLDMMYGGRAAIPREMWSKKKMAELTPSEIVAKAITQPATATKPMAKTTQPPPQPRFYGGRMPYRPKSIPPSPQPSATRKPTATNAVPNLITAPLSPPTTSPAPKSSPHHAKPFYGGRTALLPSKKANNTNSHVISIVDKLDSTRLRERREGERAVEDSK